MLRYFEISPVDRFLKFHNSILNCNKSITRKLARIQAVDCRSDFGRNIQNICRERNTLNFSSVMKGDVKYFPMNDIDKWRVPYLKELLHCKKYSMPIDIDFINLLIEIVACT